MIGDSEESRRANAFEQMALEIFNLIESEECATEQSFYERYRVGAASLPLAGSTLHQYLDGLVKAEYLSVVGIENKKFKITSKAKALMERLRSLSNSSPEP